MQLSPGFPIDPFKTVKFIQGVAHQEEIGISESLSL
jgi:hypothetical protein